jgi:hypothetical protein
MISNIPIAEVVMEDDVEVVEGIIVEKNIFERFQEWKDSWFSKEEDRKEFRVIQHSPSNEKFVVHNMTKYRLVWWESGRDFDYLIEEIDFLRFHWDFTQRGDLTTTTEKVTVNLRNNTATRLRPRIKTNGKTIL